MDFRISNIILLFIYIQISLSQHSNLNQLHFIREPTDGDVTPGGLIVFYCRASAASGAETPVISWRKDGQLLDVGSQNRYRQLSDGSLMISNVIPDDVGVYQCIARSDNHEIKSRQARMRYYRPRSKPIIIHGPVNTEVKKGEMIVLACGATGFPDPVVEWYRDGGRLSSAHSRYRVETNGTLIIENAQLDDSAHYRCSAANYLGRASSSAKVKVNLAVPDSKPVFSSLPRNATSHVSSFVEFTCVALGHPYPTVTWWNNNRIVLTDGRISVSNGGQHLRIQDLRVYDTGTYTCKAENRLGVVEVSAHLTVEEQPVPLSITNPPYDTSAIEGSTVQLVCKAEGFPEPKISWKKDGILIDLQLRRHRQSPDGSLIIFNVADRDAGLYECLADNGRERKSASANFFVKNHNEVGASSVSAQSDPNPTNGIYNTESPKPGDEFVLIALEEASNSINHALNATVENLFSKTGAEAENAFDSLTKLRFPPESEREIAKAAEIFERTLQLVHEKVQKSGSSLGSFAMKNFSYVDLISPTYLELLANMSGCEAHRGRADVKCSDMCFHAKYRTIDGTCNNLNNPLWGASLTAFKRILPPQYENGFNSPIGWDSEKLYNGFKKPSARRISTELISARKISPDSKLTHMVMQWGQFLDHDLDHAMEAISRQTFENGITCSATCEFKPPCFPIKIENGDPRITNRECMEFTRSSGTCGSGSTSIFFGKLQAREQLNRLTSFIDASQVYGNTDDLAISLRNLTNDFGRLREGPTNEFGNPLLPFNDRHDIDCRRDPRESGLGCFLTGDVRANEQLGLLSMHTIWLREHNRIATDLRELNPGWSSDRLYEESRKILGALMQHITYNHWLPLMLGPKGMELIGPYNGYDPSINPSIGNAFASAAFRFGHTMVSPILARLGSNLKPIPEGNIPLRKSFFSPWRLVQEGGTDPILRGLFATSAKLNEANEVMNSELTEHLFEAAHVIALDLAAFNIQRGRDHGLPPYVDWRVWCGIDKKRIESWHELARVIKDDEVRQKLSTLYGHPANVDLWVGGVLEDKVEGGKVGPTFQCILADQFKRLRDGDRFWYENPSTFKPDQLSQIKQATLARIICDNSDDIKKIPANVFEMQDEKNFSECSILPTVSLLPWSECSQDNEENSQRALISRHRRAIYPTHNSPNLRSNTTEGSTQRDDMTLPEAPRELEKLREKLSGRDMSSDSLVCVDYQGQIRDDTETWIHRSPNGKCAECRCKISQILCHRVECIKI